MKLEDLTNLGLTEDQAKQVQNLLKSEIDGNYVPKVTFEAERQKVKDRDNTIADRDKQITELGAFKGDAESLKRKVDELTIKNAEDKKTYDAKIAEMEMNSAIRLAVSDKVYSADDVLSKLDVTKLTIKDGKIIAGLDEQLTSIKESSPHYFKAESSESDNGKGMPPGWTPFGKTPTEGSSSASSNTAEEFGKNLAKAQLQTSAVAQRASETYFK